MGITITSNSRKGAFFMSIIHSYPHSSEKAKKRLNDMQAHSEEDYLNELDNRILNTYPADNNLCWDENHNKLSSKGD